MHIIILFLILLFIQSSFAQHVTPDVYIDRANIIQRLNDSIVRFSTEGGNWSAHALLKRSRDVLENVKVSAVLPKPHKKKCDDATMYQQYRSGLLMVGRYYDCGQCEEMHTDVNASAVVLTADGICATAHHVINQFLPSDSGRSKLDSIVFLASEEGYIFPIVEILSYSEVGDLAIIKVDTRGHRLTPVSMSLVDGLLPGTFVRTITNPTGALYAYSEGVVASNNYIEAKGQMSRRMNITADIAKGSSGGPIFDEMGNLVGLVSAIASIKASQHSHQMTIKATIPVSVIRTLFD